MAKRIGLGVIGAGRIGQVHIQTVTTRLPQAEVVAVADFFESAAESAAQKFGIKKHSGDYHTILQDPDVDAVLICSPTDTHAKIIQEAAAAGKHIFCEKPVALDLEDIKKSLEAVKAAKVKFQVGFNRRFDSNFSRVKQAVEGNEIGTPSLIHITSRDPAPPPVSYVKVSGGIFLDQTIHDFDMIRWLVDSEAVEIYAVGACHIDEDIGAAGDFDTAVITVKFENGVIGSIDNSRKAVYGYDQRVEVFGSAGSISSANNHANNTTICVADRVYRDPPMFFFLERYTESYAKEITDFVDAIRNDTETPVTGRDGLIPVIMGMAATRSAKEHRPVKMTEIMPGFPNI